MISTHALKCQQKQNEEEDTCRFGNLCLNLQPLAPGGASLPEVLTTEDFCLKSSGQRTLWWICGGCCVEWICFKWITIPLSKHTFDYCFYKVRDTATADILVLFYYKYPLSRFQLQRRGKKPPQDVKCWPREKADVSFGCTFFCSQSSHQLTAKNNLRCPRTWKEREAQENQGSNKTVAFSFYSLLRKH